MFFFQSLDPTWQKLHDESKIFLTTYVYAIIFAFGAFTDIVLITGATRKDNIGMYVWVVANLFITGPICCLIIPFIGKSNFQFSISPLDGDHLNVS